MQMKWSADMKTVCEEDTWSHGFWGTTTEKDNPEAWSDLRPLKLCPELQPGQGNTRLHAEKHQDRALVPI